MGERASSDTQRQTGSLHRGLKPIAAFGTMFFLASGGPYGVELLVPLAGPGLAVFSKVAMALLWGVPHGAHHGKTPYEALREKLRS
jgi:hypothetical protein